MGATGRRHALFWALVLVAAGVTFGLGASSSRAGAESPPSQVCPLGCTTTTTTTVPDTTTTVPVDTTTTTVAPPTPYPATFVPCLTAGASGPCNQTPQQVEVTYPPGNTPPAIEIDWGPSSSTAPSPDATSVILQWSDGSSCGTSEQCWSWPAAMTDGAYVLNGTYQVAACRTDTSGACQAPFPSTSVGLAVRPDPPASVSAASAGTEVTIRWSPPGSAPPDLAGYVLSRDGKDVYTCSTDDLGPGASVPCPQSLTVADHPGDGKFAYAVRTLRLGVDSASNDVVSSSALDASGGAVTVPGASSSTGPGGSQTGRSIPVTSIDGNGSGHGPSTSSGKTTTTVLGVTTATIPNASHSPGGAGRVADPADKSSLTLKVPSHTDVVPVAVLALGILALAVAAHFLYLKVEVGVLASRFISGRKAPE